MKQFILKNRLTLALVATGLLGGFLYWRFIGCNSGSCPITANWHSSVVLGGLLGFLIRDFFPGPGKKKGTENEQRNATESGHKNEEG